MAKSRRAGLLALANLTGFGLGYLPIGRWKTFLAIAGISSGLLAWYLFVGGFWVPLVLWILVALVSAVGILSLAGVRSYTKRTSVRAWEPLALLLSPLLVAIAASPLAAGPNREVDDRIAVAIENGDCEGAASAVEDRSWWLSLLRPSTIGFDGDIATSCEQLELAQDGDADPAERLAAIESHLDGPIAWEGAQALRTELTARTEGRTVADGSDRQAIADALAQAAERFADLEADLDTIGPVFAEALLAAAEPCSTIRVASELASTASAPLRDAYTALDASAPERLLACTEGYLARDAHVGAATELDEWIAANLESAHADYAQDLLGYVDLRTVLPDWPDPRGAVNDYCSSPKANPLLDTGTADGAVVLAHSELSDPVDAAHLAQTAATAEAVLCADVEWESGPTCSYIGIGGEARIETLQPVLRWDLWDLASGQRIDGGTRDLGSGCASSVSYEVWNGIDIPPTEAEGAIDQEAVRSVLDSALADHL
ncbi:hypothetical protein AB0K52_25565 [Glycomyces sp. NPDC049804]|uniref:hypothetical protein n=1 Tax=Glycomyces sp. NPDC049804 TaxID=3154363 RepID=UPI003445ADCA